MRPEEELQADLEKAGLSLREGWVKQLLPMRQRWQNYIKEAREIDVREEDPAHVFCPKRW